MQVEELDSPNALPQTPPPNYGQATAISPRRKPRFAAMLPPDESAPELDETTKQQLRAVFAACDDGRGLAPPRTREAVRALGLGDGEAAVDRSLAARGGARFLSCDAFCEAAAAELDRARGAEPELLKLLALFDDGGGSGTLDRETRAPMSATSRRRSACADEFYEWTSEPASTTANMWGVMATASGPLARPPSPKNEKESARPHHAPPRARAPRRRSSA